MHPPPLEKETSWLFSFKPCTRFKTIFIKIGPRVMMRRCVIARWVQQKNWFSIEITHKSCFLSFLSFRIHFHYVLSYLFGLFKAGILCESCLKMSVCNAGQHKFAYTAKYHTLDVSSIGFRDLKGGRNPPPSGCEMGQNNPALLGLKLVCESCLKMSVCNAGQHTFAYTAKLISFSKVCYSFCCNL